jgi:chromosome segregation protein
MPYIKKIEVNGFKTFGRKTTLMFEKGFTAITGPNGSGKTNIIDAVLFCLGELSSRRLRAENFSKLIFHGGVDPDVRKKGNAKVVIQFDNTDSRLPTDTTTVTLSREIDEDGQSVFRINGRRVSRAYAIEILSIAGISPYGYNVVLQGTLTRLAEISPQERRKIIEDMIGIATYDTEKEEAEKKLQTADISIKTAMGQVSEVQSRIEALEKERNDLLRHSFIQKEIRRFDAAKLSYEIKGTQEKIDILEKQIRGLEKKIDEIRTQRENLRSKRHEIEVEWRRLGFEEVEENQTRVLQIQIEIGELRSRLVELSTKLTANKSSVDNLIRVKDNSTQQINALKNEIEGVKNSIKQLTPTRDSLNKEIAEKQSVYDAINEETMKVRANTNEITKKIRESEVQLEQLHQEAINLRSQRAETESKIDVFSERLRNLKERKNDLNSALNRLEESHKELENIHKERIERLRFLQESLQKKAERKGVLETEIKEAGKIADIAREALVEFETRKNLVDKFTTEENALKYVEELGQLGVINGIHGRLKNLISIRKGYERAVEAAAAGWLNALVVENLETAFTCVETLRQLKLGRIKIVPLQGLSPAKSVRLPQIEGVSEKILSFVSYDEKFVQAVMFVLGDTYLATDEKAALVASHVSFRSVTRTGDLFEAGGGVESGFYRAPIDFSSFVPSESAMKNLDKAVTVLKENLTRRETDIGELEKEIADIQQEITAYAEALGKLEAETERTRKSIHDTKANIERAEKNIGGLQSHLEEERVNVKSYEDAHEDLAAKEKSLRVERENLRKNVDLSAMQEREQKRESIGTEIFEFKQNLGKVETDLSAWHSKMNNVLKTGLENAQVQREKALNQISTLEREINESNKEKEAVQTKIKELEANKEKLSSTLLNAKGEAKKYTSQIDEIDGKLRVLEGEYEQADILLDELRLNLQTLRLQLGRHLEQLKILGYEEPLPATSGNIQKVETSLKMMRFELERIGAVNQLAQAQYEDQISKYKELSIRMNELEKERMAIIEFIEEIERKKYNAFMEAFNKINEKIDKYFSKLTDGGNAALKLENPESPFAGGVDMIVQFIDKPPILVSGASSGERSVSAVAFLFALQEFTPASFYLLDEIDAHLDAFHVEKLGELLAEEAAKSQFVVITLKPEMVSKADRIYGIYGHEGVSHVVSTTFKGVTQ